MIAVDGPGSSGKTTVGSAAASRLGYRFFDTGLLYRALTRLAIDRGLADEDQRGLTALVDEIELRADGQGGPIRVLVDSRDVSAELHGPEVDARVSSIASIPTVRAALVGRQRALAAPGGIVMAGRDIGTVILPDADLKIYLDASVEERARRRARERGDGTQGKPVDEVRAALRRRDQLDSSRTVAPLRPAPDALVLRTDGNELEETVGQVMEAIRSVERRVAEAASRGARGVQQPPGAAPESDPTRQLDLPPPPGSTRPPRHAPQSAAGSRVASEPAGRPARALPVTPIAGHLTPLIHVCSFVARLLANAVTRVRIEGDLRAIPRDGPFILIANHASNADPVVVGAFLPPRIGRRLNWLGKREVFDLPVIGWLARHGGIHAVERTAVDLEAFRIAQRILDAGFPLAVFPEGTRSHDGALREVKDGLALLAQRTGAPIVPVGIVDSDRVWPRGRSLPRIGGRIIVRVGRPFTLAPEAGGSTGRRPAKRVATREMMGRLAALLPPRQRGAYADAVPEGPPAVDAAPGGAGPDQASPAGS